MVLMITPLAGSIIVFKDTVTDEEMEDAIESVRGQGKLLPQKYIFSLFI
jgi:hypothetical protein